MGDLTPADIGLPFAQWRPGQWPAIETSLVSDKKFIANCAPTGFGKTLYYIATALLSGERAVCLTSTKPLQDQTMREMSQCGIVDMRGRQNFPCVSGSHATCADGRVLGCRDTNCSYRAANDKFLNAKIGLTNYAYFFSSNMNAEGVGPHSTLILDEAHAAVQELSNAIEIHLNHHASEMAYHWLNTTPPQGTNLDQYRTWAKFLLPKAQAKLKELKNAKATRHLHMMDSFVMILSKIADVPGDWILDESNKQETVIAPLWPTDFAKPYLYGEVPHVILTSATLVPKTLQLLNIPEAETLFLSQSYTFNTKRCPVYIHGTQFVDFRQSYNSFNTTIEEMDAIIDRRLDRKGLIHPVSYDRQEQILSQSRHQGIMVTPRKASELRYALEEFVNSPPPRILMNPAITTGYDFPGPAAEYQFIFKLPVIDKRSPIMAARAKADPEYLPHLTAQIFMQTGGRIMRGEKDQGETFVMDRHARRFISTYKDLFAKWFLRQLQYTSGVPNPPAPLPPGWTQ